jgi:vacuolar-type H+-ATPase subunit H
MLSSSKIISTGAGRVSGRRMLFARRGGSPAASLLLMHSPKRFHSNDSFWSKGKGLFQKQSQEASEKASELLKRGSQYASESISKGAQEASQKASHATEQSFSTIKDHSKKLMGSAAETSSQLAGKASQAASQIASKSTSNIRDQSKKLVESAAETSTKLAGKAAETTKTTTVSLFSKMTSFIRQLTKATISKFVSFLTTPFRAATERISNGAKHVYGQKDRYIRALWWWSLAAIGVYGFATALPREIIKAAMTTKEDDKQLAKDKVDAEEPRSRR